jgi:AraC family transcriptional regulator
MPIKTAGLPGAQTVPVPAQPDTDRLLGILEIIESSLDDPESTGADLAARAFLSRFHFDRLVSAALGEAPGAFRRRLLLERAAHRIATTSDPLMDIALAAGYGSAAAFAHAFRHAYGWPPSAGRKRGGTSYLAPTPNGVHFHPPGGIRLPSTDRSTPMEILTKMLDHHLALTDQVLERAARLPDEVLDRSLLTVDGIDDPPTLRATTDRLVSQLEMWIAALEGENTAPQSESSSALGLRRRLASAGPRFRELVLTPINEGRADETFIDATCTPPETFTYGGVLAHVLTFSAVRRTLAIGALESAGINDLGAGDPMRYVGGGGKDAADISRN